MAGSTGSSLYLYLVTAEGNTSLLNRQQLLGSMPKMLENLPPDSVIHIEPVEQSLFTKALAMLKDSEA